MEALKEEAIQAFLSTGSGDGDGSGSGYGYGSGDGYGSGYGYGSGSGSGYGSGSGDGDGDGSGYGSGIKDINGVAVHLVDGIPTVFYRVRGSIARGAILNRDLTLSPCFVVKQDGTFAHGETLREAMEDLRDKLFEDMTEEERIGAFVEAHKPGVPYPNRELFDWHHRLTGSCEAGRKAFVANHGIDMDGSTTPEQFIALTEHDYGGGVIRKLRAFYPNTPKQRKSPTR